MWIVAESKIENTLTSRRSWWRNILQAQSRICHSQTEAYTLFEYGEKSGQSMMSNYGVSTCCMSQNSLYLSEAAFNHLLFPLPTSIECDFLRMCYDARLCRQRKLDIRRGIYG
jgi:hypothetical protein